MRVAVLTGEGRSFCAGADLKEWNDSNASGQSRRSSPFPASGFGALSTRQGLKPGMKIFFFWGLERFDLFLLRTVKCYADGGFDSDMCNQWHSIWRWI